MFQIPEPTCRIYEHEVFPYSRKYSEKAFKPIGYKPMGPHEKGLRELIQLVNTTICHVQKNQKEVPVN